MDEAHRQLLMTNLGVLARDLDPSDIYQELLAGGILTFDDKERISNKETQSDRAMELICVLLRKGPNAFGVLMNALQSTNSHLYDMLSEGVRTTGDIFKRIHRPLQTHYKDRLSDIYPVPWLQEIPLNLDKVYVGLQLKTEKHPTNAGKNIPADQLFSPQGTKKNLKRLLVEGDPGSGKSTLCQSMAHEWSQESRGDYCEPPCIHSYDLVIYLHAGDFKAQSSIVDVIRTHLFPKDSSINTETLNTQLMQETKRIIFIIDAYDEACTDNPLLEDLIRKNLMEDATVLLTSRPNYLREKLKHFDVAFTLKGYNISQQLEHVRRFAEHKKTDPTPFESMIQKDEIQGLCHNPLNLTLLCLLRWDDTQLLSSRTGLYSSIHDFILRKASERMDITPEKVEDWLLRPLYKLAFEAYQKNESVLRASDFKKVSCEVEQVCQVGYLTREVIISRLKEDLRFSFTHKTFLEYLTAKHIALMSPCERHTWLQDLCYTNYSIDVEELAYRYSSDCSQTDTVLGVLLGLLEEDYEALVQMASIIMDQTHFSSDSVTKDTCGPSHMLFRLICELNEVHPTLEDVIVERCPSRITMNNCSASCLKGLMITGNLSHPKAISMDIVLNSKFHGSRFSLLMNLVTCCENVNFTSIEISANNNTYLHNCLTKLRVGQANSFQHLKIKKIALQIDVPLPELFFGDDLRGIALEMDDQLSTHRFMEAASEKSLTSLGLSSCDLDARNLELLSEMLLSPRLQHVSLWSLNIHMGQFLDHLAKLDDLQSLDISLDGITQEEMCSFETILKKNTLSKLTFRCDVYSNWGSVLSESFSTMCDSFSAMSSLQDFEINVRNGPIHNSILTNSHHLCLQKVCLRSELSVDNLTALIKVMPSWPRLQDLEIIAHPVSSIDDGLTESATRKLIEATACCHRLNILCLGGLQIQDSLIPDLQNDAIIGPTYEIYIVF